MAPGGPGGPGTVIVGDPSVNRRHVQLSPTLLIQRHRDQAGLWARLGQYHL